MGYTIKFTSIGLILTIIGGIFSLLWMFILGILVGRTVFYPKPAKIASPPITIHPKAEKETKTTIKKAKPKKLEPGKKIANKNNKNNKNYVLQLGSFKNHINAEALHKELKEKGYQNYIKESNLPQEGLIYRVYVGPYTLKQALNVYAELAPYHPCLPLAISE